MHKRGGPFLCLSKYVEIESRILLGFFLERGFFWRRFGSDFIGDCIIPSETSPKKIEPKSQPPISIGDFWGREPLVDSSLFFVTPNKRTGT